MDLQFEIEELEELRRMAHVELDDIEDRKAEIEEELADLGYKLRSLYRKQHRRWEEEHKDQVSEFYRSLL